LQISADFETALFEVYAYLSDFCVPDERDLSTGSNFNPQNILYIPVVDPPETDRLPWTRKKITTFQRSHIF